MHIDITPEVIVTQLDLGHGEATLNQTKTAINNTKDFDKFSKHILSLNDKLKHMNAYVGLSNKESYFKIKCDTTGAQELEKEFLDAVQHWSEKYHVELRQLDNKNIFYIIGKN